jgi:hypothetical protein
MRHEVVLIGPLAAGKTSVALYVSARLRIPNYPLDRIKWYYRFKNGYDLASGTATLRSAGFGALLEYAEPFFTPTDLETFLNEFHDGVIDFGASQSVVDDPDLFSKTQRILQPFQNVILLLPSPDVATSIRVLSERIRNRYTDNERTPDVVQSYIDVNRHFIQNDSNQRLAKHTVYTNGKSVVETGEEVIAISKQDVDSVANPIAMEPLFTTRPQAKKTLPHFA